MVDLFGEGPVVVGPVAGGPRATPTSLPAPHSPRYRAAAGWPEAPRPVRSDELLPERALAGDGHARRHLVEEVYLPLVRAQGTLIETLAAYFAAGVSLEATARALFVHPNTVRYRLRQVADLTGFTPDHAARRLHAADRPGAGPAVRARATRTPCRNPTKIAGSSFVRAGGARTALHRQS